MKKYSLLAVKNFFRTHYSRLINIALAACLLYTLFFLYSTVYQTIFSDDTDTTSPSTAGITIYDGQLSSLISTIKEHQLQEVPAEIPAAANPFHQETTQELPTNSQNPRPL